MYCYKYIAHNNPISLHTKQKNMQNIADIRKDYKLLTLTKEEVLPNPIEQFQNWFAQAMDSKIDEVNAMCLSTVQNNKPSSRIVLLKDVNQNGFSFFTNYESKKGNQIAQNPNASLCFYWKELERQVRIEGIIAKLSETLSDDYFNSRPLGSKLGAWASPQSSVIESRKVLEEREAQYKQKFGEQVTRPPHWGGYILKPSYIEFWQGRSNRLHDRICYTLQENGGWTIERLAP